MGSNTKSAHYSEHRSVVSSPQSVWWSMKESPCSDASSISSPFPNRCSLMSCLRLTPHRPVLPLSRSFIPARRRTSVRRALFRSSSTFYLVSIVSKSSTGTSINLNDSLMRTLVIIPDQSVESRDNRWHNRMSMFCIYSSVFFLSQLTH